MKRAAIHLVYIAWFFIAGRLHAQDELRSVFGRIVLCDSFAFGGSAEVRIDPGYRSAYTDAGGNFGIRNLKPGAYRLHVTSESCQEYEADIRLGDTNLVVLIHMQPLSVELKEVTIEAEGTTFGQEHLRAVEGTSIYASKKSEVIPIEKMTLNLAANNSRQIFARVPGMNIWESDPGGVQLGVASRGLSPNRTSSFNTRQNGYDMSADAMGYPESYYTPPAEALRRIEVVRGAASLQYGTQFGGMMNFVMKTGNEKKRFEFTSRQTGGAWGFFNSFNSVGGTRGKLTYYTYYQFKRSNGWRKNSGFNLHNVFVSLQYRPSEKWKLGLDYTFFHYLARQPGGLTDAMFANDPSQSVRDRNWFLVNWNLFALQADRQLGEHAKVNTRFFGLVASRQALGFLGQINRSDPGGNRDLISGFFRNWGNETRFLRRWSFLKNTSVFLAGLRYYEGRTRNVQGDAHDGSDPDFNFIHPDSPERSDFEFPSRNLACFTENVFNISSRFSITPGLRFEYIRTASDGYYKLRETDLAGNVILEQKVNDSQTRARSLLLAGIGASFRLNGSAEIYGNISQNYRAINFSDLRVVNPNLKVNPDIRDERGYNADLGVRGSVKEWLSYDVSVFTLRYNDRIGVLLRSDTTGTYRYRTNVADSRTLGLEGFAEADIWRMITGRKTAVSLNVFCNLSVIHARYVNTDDPSVRGKRVELVPAFSTRDGLQLKWKKLGVSLQSSWTASQFTDATNAEFTANAVNGRIPSYYVVDFSLDYSWRYLKLEASLTNLTQSVYFTRRADGYPGPGIIPADPRAFYLTVQARL